MIEIREKGNKEYFSGKRKEKLQIMKITEKEKDSYRSYADLKISDIFSYHDQSDTFYLRVQNGCIQLRSFFHFANYEMREDGIIIYNSELIVTRQ